MTILAFLVVFSILVFVHELGHFLAAKAAGVRVECFSIGFGPSIFKKRIGETLYQVACIPLGGFVKLSGEDPEEEAAEREKNKDKEKDEDELPPCPPERMLNNKSVPRRLSIFLAGPTMNLLLAFLLVPMVYFFGIEVDSTLYQPARIGFMEPEGPAAKGGLVPGDLIVRINGKSMPDWKKVKTYVLFHPRRTLSIEVERSGQIINKLVETDTLPSIGGGNIGVYPDWPSKIKNVVPGKPADKAGIKPGDLIVRIGELDNPHWFETQTTIQKHANLPLAVTVDRNGEKIVLQLTPEPRPDAPDSGFIGIEPEQTMMMRRFGLFPSIKLGIMENIENAYTTVLVVVKLIKGDLNLKAVGGPVQIAEFTGSAAQEGLTHLILFMAYFSLQLGILNLLPIPVLDGGHVLFVLIEAIKGKPLSHRVRATAQQVGMVLLFGLMILVTVNDVSRYQEPIKGFFKNLFH